MDFDRETALTTTGDGLFHAELDPVWSVIRGPNGGYIAALILNAMRATVGDDGRHPRALTIHYIAPAATEPLEIATTVERTGRSMTAVSSRAIQGDNVIAVALGAFSTDRPGPELDDAVMPAVMAPGDVPVREIHGEAPPIAHRWDTRQVIGRAAFQDVPPSERAQVAAWMRLPEGHLPDAAVVAAATDGFIPAVFSRVDEPMVVPTVDLTIHFRRPLPYEGATPDDFLLGHFTTKVISGGFLEEDGEIWSSDGLLLAQSRQLAVAFPFTPPPSA